MQLLSKKQLIDYNCTRCISLFDKRKIICLRGVLTNVNLDLIVLLQRYETLFVNSK